MIIYQQRVSKRDIYIFFFFLSNTQKAFFPPSSSLDKTYDKEKEEKVLVIQVSKG